MYIGSIVLAGGRSRRMGRPKEALPFGDSTLLGHTVDMLLQCTHPVVIVARDPEQELPPLPPEVDVLFDDRPGEGPLVGIAAGLRALAHECDAAFIASCDMPFLPPAVIGWMAERLGDADLVITRAGGVLQPLAALYRTRVLGAVEKLLDEGIRTPRALVERVSTRELGDADVDAFDATRRFLQNINEPEDYERAQRAAGANGPA